MKRALLKYFFERDYSAAHAAGAAVFANLALYHHRYALAALAFVVCVVVSVFGELALEKSA
jgi:hypothetical protein